MKRRFEFLLNTHLILFALISSSSLAQNNYEEKKSTIYLGLDINLATIFTGTSIKSAASLKGGYNYLLTSNIHAGPQIKVLFIKSPTNKGLIASIFVGPSAEIEYSKKYFNHQITKDISMFSNRFSWVFPINSKSSDYIYKDCISITTSYKTSKFNFFKTSIDMNLDFQGYDLGFYSGFKRMINISIGTVSTFN